MWEGGGAASALRAYQAYHPNAAIYMVTYRGRTVWMTSKQRAIWHEVQKYWRRGTRDTLERIAKACGCSKATVSRFLRRLDLWRFLNLATIRGHGGGTYIFTRNNPYMEEEHHWTESKRQRLRRMLAVRVKRNQLRELLENKMVQARLRMLHQRLGAKPKPPVKIGSTGATFPTTQGLQLALREKKM
jgi:hypothetical protein